MKLKNLLLIVALMAISGFIGGLVAYAAQPNRVVIAEEFRLVDKDGNLCGRLYVDDRGRGELDLLPQTKLIQ